MQRFFFHPDGRLAGSYDGPDAGNPHPGLDFTHMAPEDGQQIWDGTTWTWPLAALRERKLQAIEERYQAALANGVLFRGKTLQLRPQDQQNLIAKGARAKFVLAGLGRWPADAAWIMADNSFLPLDAAGMSEMADAAEAQVTAWRFLARRHKDAILALTAPEATPEAILAYDIEKGW